ncbi:FtsW/RodA/SpoVE family cell cycle protein [Ekhidna sp.]|uniref:FtsW/RodA/SpoVE family cell cycle protein n=1 Tax=Ekhidna sp. TaxID=2608089 RepID=UPI003BA9AE4E
MNKIKNWAYRNLKGDPVIWFIVLILSLFSILVVYSATGSLAYKMMDGNTEYYLFKHAILMVASLVTIWVVHRIDFRYYSKVSRLVLWLCVPLLLFTWMFGNNLNGATRTLTIPLINQSFQTSDLASLALLVTLASMLSKRQKSIDDFQKAIVPMLFWIGLICGLIALANFSSAILLFLTCMLVLFIGRVPMKYLAMLVVICASFGSVAFMIGQRGGTAVSRVENFFSDETPYQAQQAYIAIASGGVIGKGPGQSDQRNFLPHPYSDFIYAIILEEYGLIGGVLILFLYLALLYRGMKAAEGNDRAYGGLLSAGLSFALVIQAFVNMGVSVGLGPVTGLTLPFISMGGTSQLFAGLALGIILSVSRGEIDRFGSTIGNQYKEAA